MSSQPLHSVSQRFGPLFATAWYVEQNAEAVDGKKKALAHYLEHGWREGRNPHPLFDVSWYLLGNPDVARAELEPLTHYLEHGWREGRSPHPAFSLQWYLQRYRDVADAGVEPLTHYVTKGYREHRSPHPLFDTEWYVQHHPGLADEKTEPLTHYLSQNWKAKYLMPSGFFDRQFLKDTGALDASVSPLDFLLTPPERPNVLFDPEVVRESLDPGLASGMSLVERFIRDALEGKGRLNQFFSCTDWHELFRQPNLPKMLGRAAHQSYRAAPMYADGSVVLRDVVVGPPPAAHDDLAIFVHYDAEGEVQPYVIDYLENLRRDSVSILFVSGNATLTDAAMQRLSGIAWRVITTKNEAYDWGLYSIGVKRLGPELEQRNLIFANDSCAGSLFPFTPFLTAARSGSHDIYGATDSRELTWHLQSYFFWISSRVTTSEHWRDFWQRYAPVADKNYVITAYELGFTRFMLKAGFSLAAHWKYDEIIEMAKRDSHEPWRIALLKGGRTVNTTHICWDLLVKAGCPFLKRQLIASNPAAIPNLHLVLNLLGARGSP